MKTRSVLTLTSLKNIFFYIFSFLAPCFQIDRSLATRGRERQRERGTKGSTVDREKDRFFIDGERSLQAIQVVPRVSAFETLMGAYEYFIPRGENTRAENDVVCVRVYMRRGGRGRGREGGCGRARGYLMTRGDIKMA